MMGMADIPMQAGGQSQPVKNHTENIESELDSVGEAITFVEEAMGGLVQNITAVLIPEGPEPGASAIDPPVETGNSYVLERLKVHRMKLIDLKIGIERISVRVQL